MIVFIPDATGSSIVYGKKYNYLYDDAVFINFNKYTCQNLEDMAKSIILSEKK